jgi:choline transporter-like protein 2/4/5
MTAIVFLPLVQAAATLAFLVVFFVYCVYVATAGEKELVETDKYGRLDMPYHTYDISNDQLYALWYLLFDAFWTLEFLAALGQLVVATAAATYYFTRDKSTVGSGVVVASARKSLFYHAGTAACGSLLIGLLRWVKAVLLYVQRKCETALARGGVAKNVARCVFCGLQCFLWCLEKCLKFLNKQAYIQTAIFGYSFCKAARKGFFLVLRNVRRVAALDAVANLIFFVTKVLVAVTCGLACFFWLGLYYREETHSILYPSLVVALVAYEVAAIFVGVVDMVADTLLVCFIADEEIYGAGSADCFATPRLRKHVAKASGKQLGTF